jgi:uncharacterized SAM-binding protein YcdF (DUF218 family)
MYFLLSKALIWVLKPLFWILAAGAYGLWGRSVLWRKRMRWLSWGLLVVATNPWLANRLIDEWELGQPERTAYRYPYASGIVLGGYLNFQATRPERVVFNRSGTRLTSALELYHAGRIRRIVLTGGGGSLLRSSQAEAPVARQWLLTCGVPDSAIVIESDSRNTLENAAYSHRVLDSLHLAEERHLLISSAWHLRRAAPCYERAGLHCEVYGTDFLGEHLTWENAWVPDWDAMTKWETLLKEYVGWLTYHAKGWK